MRVIIQHPHLKKRTSVTPHSLLRLFPPSRPLSSSYKWSILLRLAAAKKRSNDLTYRWQHRGREVFNQFTLYAYQTCTIIVIPIYKYVLLDKWLNVRKNCIDFLFTEFNIKQLPVCMCESIRTPIVFPACHWDQGPSKWLMPWSWPDQAVAAPSCVYDRCTVSLEAGSIHFFPSPAHLTGPGGSAWRMPSAFQREQPFFTQRCDERCSETGAARLLCDASLYVCLLEK